MAISWVNLEIKYMEMNMDVIWVTLGAKNLAITWVDRRIRDTEIKMVIIWVFL
jgi:hypothetical protein